MASSSLRPLTLGELIDRSVRLWRAHLWPLARTMLPFVLVGHLLSVISQTFLLQDFEALAASESIGAMMGTLGLVFLLYFLNACIVWFGQLLVARDLIPRVTGEPVATRGGGRLALRGTLQLLLLFLLWGVGTVAVLLPTGLLVLPVALMSRDLGGATPIVLLVLAMGVAFLFWFGFLLWWMLRMHMALPVIAGESADGWALFRRGGTLLRGRSGPGLLGRSTVRAAIVFTVMSLLVTVAQLVATIPRLLLEAVYRAPDEAAARIPWLWRVPAEVVVAGGQALFGPLLIAGCVLFYVDQRVRREGLDLELGLRRAP